jgi:iron complex outermembrane receptor protein
MLAHSMAQFHHKQTRTGDIMNKRPGSLVALIAAMFCFVNTSSLMAQSNDTDDADDDSMIEEIIVTATKREESIYDVPIAITAFTQETMERAGITDLTDVGKFVPNLNVTGFSAGHVSSVNPFIRGIGLQDHLITTEPGVGVYVDGVYLGRQVGQNWSLANVERVEVLRGPQGTLYGRNSIGGAINIITRQPGDENGGRMKLYAGTRGRIYGDIYYNAALSESFAVSATGSWTKRDGVGDFLNLDTSTEVGEINEWAGRIAAKWSPTESFSLLFAYDKNDGDGGLRPYTTLIDEVPTGLLYQLGARNSDVSADPYDNNGGFYVDANGNIVASNEVTNEADGWSVTADWQINETFSSKLIYSDRSSDYTSGLDDDSVEETLFTYPESGQADQQSAELQFFGDFGSWDFVSGLYWFEEDGSNLQDPNFFAGGPGAFYLEQSAESQAIYANVGFNVTENLRLSGGARYTEDEKSAYTAPVVGLLFESNSRDWSETSWEVAAAWDMTERLNLYGTIQNGYQSGQYPARPYCLFANLDFNFPPGNVSRPNCFVASDNVTATNYEIGLKGNPLDNLQMSIAAFYTDYKDLPYQVSESTGGGFNTVNLIVDQTSKGLEWESAWAATEDFTLFTSMGYIDADIDDPNPTVVAPLTPEVTASISPQYIMLLGTGAELMFRVDWSYRGDMYGEPSNDPGRFTKIDSRDLFNFDVTYTEPKGRWSLSAYGRNVTDEKYDNARLLPTDYVLIILNNDRSEFGLRYIWNFGEY